MMGKDDYDKMFLTYTTIDLLNYLSYASSKGDLDMVKYISNLPYIKSNIGYFINENSPLVCASSDGQLDVLKYFLTSVDFDLTPMYPSLLSIAFFNKQKPIMEYLLYSPELKKHANIHHNKDQIFRDACVRDLDMVQYLIFDLNIEKTKRIDTFLTHLKLNPPNQVKEIIEMFEKRELAESLQNELTRDNKEISNKRIKI